MRATSRSSTSTLTLSMSLSASVDGGMAKASLKTLLSGVSEESLVSPPKLSCVSLVLIRGSSSSDRRNVHWDADKPYDPRAARRTSRPGDFDLSSLVLEDLLVTVYQPGDFRPFNFSIFSAVVPRLRKQWLFYDLLGADSITGQVDGCLFSLHKPQRVGKSTEKDAETQRGRWRTLVRFCIRLWTPAALPTESFSVLSCSLVYALMGLVSITFRIKATYTDLCRGSTLANSMVRGVTVAMVSGACG